MKKTIEDVRNDFIDTIGETAERYGLTRIAGLLKGFLYVSRKPLSLDDMAQQLEVSKGSVSTNISWLERWKVVRRVFNRGDRKNYYEMRGTIWEIETEILKTIFKDELERFTEYLARWKNDLEEAENGDTEEKEFLAQRFSEIEEYLGAAKHMLEIFTREGKVTPAIIKKIQIT